MAESCVFLFISALSAAVLLAIGYRYGYRDGQDSRDTRYPD